MDCIIDGVTKSRTRLSDLHFHIFFFRFFSIIGHYRILNIDRCARFLLWSRGQFLAPEMLEGVCQVHFL